MCLFSSCCANADELIDETDCGECSQQCEFIEEVAHFCSEERDAEERDTEERDTSYVFFSLNCQLLRGVCKGQGGPPAYLNVRAACLANRLASIAEFIDAIALQECFDRESTALLIRKLTTYFPHVTEGKSKSGCVILSKLPVKHSVFHGFKTSSGGERVFFDKGVLGVALCDPDKDTTVCVFNTHFQSDFWRKSRDTRQAQAQEMKTFVEKSMRSKRFLGSSKVDAAVVCGDLNCDAGSAEYEKIMEILGGNTSTFRDTLPVGDEESLQTFPECTYSLKKKRYVVKENTKKKRLDYIFEISGELNVGEKGETRRRKTKARVVRTLRDDNNVPLSDHRGIIVAIERVYI